MFNVLDLPLLGTYTVQVGIETEIIYLVGSLFFMHRRRAGFKSFGPC